ncbi:uncharacterized protein UMAG_11465 [Mycosarcoma maydis]|uniref:Uncharacterized protein n=1 Tax=Mycosarcoma maydis TaxID=5270 RepID=A0A0D1CSR5_MYCMD|nr:uncharacterized protein UMAG_11465 [Ustilago maydis 521]KIS69553.1 hypothetical protein UMAG_11465 [Ustilago maydis 521]|eukprot:XP_011388867.1 hypothetical protein UMAG_11465 [Ustilago maydis 521]
MLDDAFGETCSVSCSSSSSPAVERTLRRRRSAASASLLSKPSMLTLGRLDPSFETCVLVYLTCWPSSTRLVYALFEPNFLVDGSSRAIRKLDRSTWERLRSHVEELRIVALSCRFDQAESGAPDARTRRSDCMFDLSTRTDDATITRMYLQPQSYTSVPARCKDDLLEIEIHSPSDEGLAKERKVCLPDQVRTVLQDAEQLMQDGDAQSMISPSTGSSGSQQAKERVDSAEFASVCDRILRLVQDI